MPVRPARPGRSPPEAVCRVSDPQHPDGPGAAPGPESDAARRRRRDRFLRELHEAKALRERVQPRRARAARMRQALRRRTFRW
ncbi:hypothetical protein OG422_16510 [Streptomyces sp. NBC_01525]|uniref:hypothetical protein n=1 Tax=Streptomyces sp. NBC_01525 TaxID=2903893 RepID=UPI003864A31D